MKSTFFYTKEFLHELQSELAEKWEKLDVIDFVKIWERITFVEAIEVIAARLGIEPQYIQKGEEQKMHEKIRKIEKKEKAISKDLKKLEKADIKRDKEEARMKRKK